jgi:hypothetical protein
MLAAGFTMIGSDEKNLDVLQNIEYAIISIYRADPSLLDMDVKDALDTLVRHYRAEEEERRPSAPRLAELAQKVFVSVQGVCEWRLGRPSLSNDEESIPGSPIPLAELVEALKKIQKSVRRWSSVGGRRGYLNFIGQYLP